MINLWYNTNAYPPGVVRGPVKVLDNTIRALEDLNIPFSLNSEKYKCNWILHWDPKFYMPLKSRDKILVGPQIWPFEPSFSLLGQNDTVTRSSPVQVGGLTAWTSLARSATSSYSSIALKT
jgi:hypothetical protein